MNYTKETLSLVENILSSSGWDKDISLASLLYRWEDFVVECEKGYDWDIDEYYNDIRVREIIELLLKNPILSGFDDFQDFSKDIAIIDERFKKLLLPMPMESKDNSVLWWEKGILCFAGSNYAEDVFKIYKIHINIKN